METDTQSNKKNLISILKSAYSKLEGKKTYIIMAVAIIFAGIDTWNDLCGNSITDDWCVDIHVPSWVFGVLAVLGIYTRSARRK